MPFLDRKGAKGEGRDQSLRRMELWGAVESDEARIWSYRQDDKAALVRTSLFKTPKIEFRSLDSLPLNRWFSCLVGKRPANSPPELRL